CAYDRAPRWPSSNGRLPESATPTSYQVQGGFAKCIREESIATACPASLRIRATRIAGAWSQGRRIRDLLLVSAESIRINCELQTVNSRSIQIEIPDQRLARIGVFLGAAQRFLELLFQQIATLLLRIHRLPEDGIAPSFLLMHGARRLVQVVKGLGTLGRGVGDDRARLRIDLQHRPAIRAGYL